MQVDVSIRRECLQCGVTSYPHSQCRCRVCGLRHAHGSGCRHVPVLCAQCGSRTAPHKACPCCRCGKIHTIRAGCRPLSALNIRRLPIDSQRDILRSRVNCHQCGQFTAAHSSCRCRNCGSCHSTTQACRNNDNRDVAPVAPLPTCPQCLEVSYPHPCCMCRQCGRVHTVGRHCMHTTLTEPRPVMLRAAVSTGDRPVPVHDAGAMDIVCTCCGARTWRSEKMRCCGNGAV